jgi:hypothetical protein
MPKKRPTRRRRSRQEREIHGQMLQKLRAGQDVRATKVRKIRAAIASRTYENPLKLAVCVDRLLVELAKDR